MAKKAYIGVDGVARKLKKGYIGVDGVSRKIKKAYIGIGGVARLFYTSSNAVPFTEFFQAMEPVSSSDGTISGRNSSSTSTVRLSIGTGTVYIASICNGYMGVYKIENRSVITTLLAPLSTSYGNVYISGTYVYYSNTGTTSSSVYGATLVSLSFTGYTDVQIAETFQSLQLITNSGHNGSAPANVYCQSSDLENNSLLVVANDSNIAFNLLTSPSDAYATKISGNGPGYGTMVCKIDTRWFFGGDNRDGNDKNQLVNGGSILNFTQNI